MDCVSAVNTVTTAMEGGLSQNRHPCTQSQMLEHRGIDTVLFCIPIKVQIKSTMTTMLLGAIWACLKQPFVDRLPFAGAPHLTQQSGSTESFSRPMTARAKPCDEILKHHRPNVNVEILLTYRHPKKKRTPCIQNLTEFI